MRAVVITRFGGPEVLEIRDVPAPAPGSDEVLIHVRSSALNRADLLQRAGGYAAPRGAPQNISGLEFAGEVEELGTNARRWHKGDRVMGIIAGGAHAEFVAANQDAVAAVPPNLEWSAAGAIPEVFITAHDALLQAGFKAVLDLNGGPYFAASLEAMSLRGRIILIGGVAGGKTNVDLYQILRKRLHVIGTIMRARSLQEKIANTTAFAQEVVPLLAKETIQPVIDSVFPLDQIQAAHRRLESNETFGKVVLTLP